MTWDVQTDEPLLRDVEDYECATNQAANPSTL
jgi:hypothetical protein